MTIFRGESFVRRISNGCSADSISTGSVILGGFIRAAKMASDASGRDPREHKVVFLGGGSAAVGYVYIPLPRSENETDDSVLLRR